MINARIAILSAALLATMVPIRPAAAQRFDRSTPTGAYYSAFSAFYDGDYLKALKTFQSESRSSIKTAHSRWIDSICYETMCGECYYQMGVFDKALRHYTAALQIFNAFPNWMMKVQFPPSIRVAGTGSRKAVPWGVSSRQSPLGAFPSSMLIGQGQIDMNDVIQHGGVVQQANLSSIRPQEIVRATALALRRRTALLGPVAPYDSLTKDLITAMNQPIGPPNHWSQSWTNLQRGLATAAGRKQQQAVGHLERAVLAAGQFDHPLTGVALLELGREALKQGKYPAAARFFDEATYAAVNYPDYNVLEEAFRYRVLVHLISGTKGFFKPLNGAIQWAKVKHLRQLRASLLLCAAENYAAMGQSHQAAAMLDEARATIGRRKMGAGAIGARLSYLSALVNYQQKHIADGNMALAAAMGYMQHGSLWLFHIGLADEMYLSGGVTPRMAMGLFDVVLRDPQPNDWAYDPMESLASLVTPHPLPLEHWFNVALERKETPVAIEIAERARRHRFFSSLEFGGRLESLRWLLEAPTSQLSQQAILQRQEILAHYPAYDKLSQQAKAIHKDLARKPLVAEDTTAVRKQSQALSELGSLGLGQEAILREIALRRQPVALVFPPLRGLSDVQKTLPDKHAVLVFFAANRRLYGFLLNNERFTVWEVGSPSALVKQIQEMLRAMGNYHSNHELAVGDLTDQAWKQAAKQVLDTLLKGSPADFTQPLDELVIVPDGVLWYLPFEALQIKADGREQSLIERFRIRYAPTLSLATCEGSGRGPARNTAVVLGKLYPRDDDDVAHRAFDQLAAVVPGAVALRPPVPAPTAIYSTVFDHLVVFDDIPLSDQAPYGWAPAPIDRNKTGATLADWLLLPWGGPDVVVLPGFHTAAEDSLKRVSKGLPGNDVFLSVCGLMANGARTVLLSRWRTGGQTSFDQAREFTQELSRTSPADAWQRAVQLTIDARLNLDAEPRLKLAIKRSTTDGTPKSDHPFFWAGTMLIDCGTGPEPLTIDPNKPAPSNTKANNKVLKKPTKARK